MAAAAAIALAVAGRTEATFDTTFAPVAFRRTLLASLVLAVADAQFLFLYAGLEIERHDRAAVLLLAAGVVLGVAIAGLYRLRVWALLVLVVTTGGTALLARAGWLGFTPLLVRVWTALAAAQLLLSLPVWVAAARRLRRAPSAPRASSGRA
jgi:hypothetical protein